MCSPSLRTTSRSEGFGDMVVSKMEALRIVVPGKFSASASQVYDFNRKQIGSADDLKKHSLPAPKPAVSKFLSEEVRYRFYQAPLALFRKWYSDYQFASLIDDPIEGKVRWEYRLIFLHPSSSNATGDDHVLWAKELLCDFYEKSSYLQPYGNMEPIRYSVEHDISIVLICLKMAKDANSLATWRNNRGVKVISAITFRQGKKEEACSALITWMYVTKFEDCNRAQTLTWRRVGLGTFMLIPVIKLCVIDGRNAMAQVKKPFDPMKAVQLYLQCTHEMQKRFFESCGFVQINTIKASTSNSPQKEMLVYDGHFMLPTSIRESVTDVKDKVFILNRRNMNTPEYVTPALYKLRGGEFKVKTKFIREVVDLINSPMDDQKARSIVPTPETFIWCRYPLPTKQQTSKCARLTDADVSSVFESSRLLQRLLPQPLRIPLLFPKALCCRGEMTSIQRLAHTAETYMSTGEMEMMLALLLCDGRYDNEVSIVPLSYVPAISEAAAVHAKFESACLVIDNLTKQRASGRNSHVMKKFGKTTDDTYFADVYDETHPKWNEYFEIRMYGAQYDEETKVSDCYQKTRIEL